ncbi:uncharacterized protein LOC132732412 [Ruditapes philippinarum]|uniref:uncharacterized protein LOC132732412 n=1 Tax=Ruditapes philippinarum TaxID=129788 RepID=UPI00295AC90C|nr:uncharacterized protein LOC132732412 [Ruditapes philippinarum]
MKRTYHPYKLKKRINPKENQNHMESAHDSDSYSVPRSPEIIRGRPLALDKNVVEPGSFSDFLTSSSEPTHNAITEISSRQNEEQLADTDSGSKRKDVFEKVVKEAREIIHHKMLQIQHWRGDEITLWVGGKSFVTTKSTLMKEPSFLYKLNVTADSVITIDRDPSHFKFILNYLRYDCTMPIGCLPNDLQVMNELKQEASYFCLPKLEFIIQKKIVILQELLGLL